MNYRVCKRLMRMLGCMLALGAVIGAVPAGAAPVGQAGAGGKLVLAFYYTWYSPADFTSGQMLDMPTAPYSSGEAGTVERQVTEARDAGIDGFITSWSGLGTPSDASFAQLLDVAGKNNFKATVYVETGSVMQQGDLVGQLQGMIGKYADNPAFLKWDGKPVVFFWSPQSLGGAAEWQAVRQAVDPGNGQVWSVDTTDASLLDVFDTIHFFSGGKWDASTDVAQVDAQWSAQVDAYNKQHGTQRLWTAGVIPGWDESRVLPPRANAKVFARGDGALYAEAWQGAMASNPAWVTITSFNEWYEGTQIEPAVSYGTKYLDMTADYAHRFKGDPPTQAPKPVAGACAGGNVFPETGFAICAAMQAYWDQYGGLQQFGFPISYAFSEKSALDGNTYTVQYFERAVFEMHPGNPPPYDVLLSQLGTFQYRKSYPDGAPDQKQNQEGGQLFPETGKWVGGAFLERWQNNGGLFVNGYPISDEFQEKQADGNTYTVQYFERARFEFHPENAAPYNVLLGALGRVLWGERTGG